MTEYKQYLVQGINPAPWAVGPLGVGRRKGGHYAYVGPNAALVTYQKALREALEEKYNPRPLGQQYLDIEFYFWRKIETYQSGKRTAHSHVADVTNLQKATEDALQGFLFDNDRQTLQIRSEIIEQSEDTHPCVVIRIRPYAAYLNKEWLERVQNEIDFELSRAEAVNDNVW